MSAPTTADRLLAAMPADLRGPFVREYIAPIALELDRVFAHINETKEPSPMANTANPYDRRHGNRRDNAHDFELAHGGPLLAMPAEAHRAYHAPDVLAMEDLEALAFSVGARSERKTMERLERFHADAIHTARREAWAEGHAAGTRVGADALLKTIAEQFEEAIGDLRSRLIEFHGRLDPQAVWDAKKKLGSIDLIAEARDMLAKLVHAHHGDFGEPVPF